MGLFGQVSRANTIQTQRQTGIMMLRKASCGATVSMSALLIRKIRMRTAAKRTGRILCHVER